MIKQEGGLNQAEITVKLFHHDGSKVDSFHSKTGNVEWSVNEHGEVSFTLKNGATLESLSDEDKTVEYEVCVGNASPTCSTATIELIEGEAGQQSYLQINTEEVLFSFLEGDELFTDALANSALFEIDSKLAEKEVVLLNEVVKK